MAFTIGREWVFCPCLCDMSELNYKLESFEGPLDLLLYLINRNKVDIRDIPIAEILRQYMEYIPDGYAFRGTARAPYTGSQFRALSCREVRKAKPRESGARF